MLYYMPNDSLYVYLTILIVVLLPLFLRFIFIEQEYLVSHLFPCDDILHNSL